MLYGRSFDGQIYGRIKYMKHSWVYSLPATRTVRPTWQIQKSAKDITEYII